jgi:hypothetical protein
MAEPVVIGEPRPDRNRRIVVLAGIAAVLVLAVVVLPGVLFGGGDGGDDEFDFPPVASPSTTTTAPGDAPAETFETFSDTNPFTPLVELGPAPGDVVAPPDDTATTIPLDDDGFTFPEDPDATFPPEDEGTTTSTTVGPPPRQPDRVSLLEVFTEPSGRIVASVRVNDSTHQVAEGDVFATSYRVLDLDIRARCGQFLFGDDRFGLCEGEETLK